MTYFVYMETGFVSNAETEAEAKEEATQYFIEQLQRQNVEFLIEDEE